MELSNPHDPRDRSLEYSVCSSDLEVDVLDDEDESDASSEGSVAVPGWYPSQEDKLQKADEAAIARGRSMKRTSSERIAASENAKKTKASQGSSTQLVHVSPQQRVKEFPGEFLTVSSGKLYCEACRTVVAVKKSVVKLHVTSERHKSGEEKCEQQSQRQQCLKESWESYQKRHSLAGRGLSAAVPTEQCLRRIETHCDCLLESRHPSCQS